MIGSIKKWLSSSSDDALHGGIAFKRNKPGLPVNGVIKTLETPDTIKIPLLNYQREILKPSVCVGQYVRLSETLAPGVIASCAGTVIEIEPHAIAHPSGISAPCIVIKTQQDINDAQTKSYPELASITLKRIDDCSIHGLGGAGFHTASKLERPSKTGQPIETLIINAVECEPLISCDESLLITESNKIIEAIQNLILFTNCTQCILAIEDDKPQALAALNTAISVYSNEIKFEVKLLPAIYPAGAEKPLVERLTQQAIPRTSYPADLGIVCINVSTALAMEQARLGYPMISRVVTIAGDLSKNPVNVRVRFGTSVAEVLKQTNNEQHSENVNIRIGGPLSGFTIDDLSIPITATTNSITIESAVKTGEQLACIRCSACSDVCPIKLLPQQLYQHSKNENAKQAESLGINACIECGCCDLVCPSNIPLTHSFRFLKGYIKEQHRQDDLAQVAELRYQKREQRQIERSDQRVKKREAAKQRLVTDETPVADALERAKQRRKNKSARRQPSSGDQNSANPNDTGTSGTSRSS